jgi:hypothetical protein
LFMQHDCTDICSPRYISTFSKSLIQRYFRGVVWVEVGANLYQLAQVTGVPGFRACLHFNGFLLFVEKVFM